MKQPTERLQNELRSDSNISQRMNPNFAVLGMPSNYRKEDGQAANTDMHPQINQGDGRFSYLREIIHRREPVFVVDIKGKLLEEVRVRPTVVPEKPHKQAENQV